MPSAFAGLLLGQNSKPAADRLAAQNALFEAQYESDLKNFPERATAFGDYRYNDKLADYSLEAIAQRNKTNQEFLVDMRTFHDEILDGGPLPLDMLEVRTDKWIAQQKANAPPATKQKRGPHFPLKLISNSPRFEIRCPSVPHI